MKLKTWHLFLVIIILFGCSFYIVNLKFDKFYRVNGINNDNRVVIEKYLDEDEQDYLIENQISIDLFIEYIKKDDFHLKNYQYYNNLKDSKRYSSSDHIIEVGNNLATRLTYLFRDDPQYYAQQLVMNSLEMSFLNNENFNFDYFDYYKEMRPLYNDDLFITDTENYILRLQKAGYKTKENLLTAFNDMCKSYTKETLNALLTSRLPEDVELVLNPYKTDTLVDKKHYIGEYEPTQLILIQDIPRIRYTMYLQSEAYIALTNMYEAMLKEAPNLLLLNSYQSSLSIDKNKVGFDEMQLGYTIEVTKTQTKYDDFKNTDVSEWLENNAYKYGYILRYPNKKASITNQSYNAHFYRYVGIDLAKQLHENSLILEEYNAKK